MILAFELVQVPVAPPRLAPAMRKQSAQRRLYSSSLSATADVQGLLDKNLPLHTGWVWSVSDLEGDTEKGGETKTSIQTISGLWETVMKNKSMETRLFNNTTRCIFLQLLVSSKAFFRVKPAEVRTISAHDSLNSQSPPTHGLIQVHCQGRMARNNSNPFVFRKVK